MRSTSMTARRVLLEEAIDQAFQYRVIQRPRNRIGLTAARHYQRGSRSHRDCMAEIHLAQNLAQYGRAVRGGLHLLLLRKSQHAGHCIPHLTVHRSEEHTSELQSLRHLVCRLLLEKKKK